MAAVGTQTVSTNIAGASQTSAEAGAAADQVLEGAGELSCESEQLHHEIQEFVERLNAA